MTVSLKHKFVSAKSDGADATRVRASNWNDEHDLIISQGTILGRTAAGDGPATELTVSGDLSLASGVLGIGSSVATLTGTQTLTGKTINGSSNTITNVPLSTGVTGTLPVANGGSGATALTGVLIGNGTSAFTAKTNPSGDFVGTTDTQTLTNKTLGGVIINDGYTEEVATANTGTAYTIDLAGGSVQVLTLTGNVTFTFPTVTAGRSFLLVLRQDATGGRTATWPTSTNPVRWPGGTAPTLTSTASRTDLFGFTADGTRWYGRTIAQNYSA